MALEGSVGVSGTIISDRNFPFQVYDNWEVGHEDREAEEHAIPKSTRYHLVRGTQDGHLSQDLQDH